MAGECILIVDDEESIQQLLGRVCQQAGYDVSVVGDGASAYQALGETRFDVSIVDLRLPDTDGIQILRQVKQRQPDCEVIILTGYGDLQTAVEALRLGAYDYLQKPLYDLQIILASIARALERQRLARHNAELLHDLQAANRQLEARRRQQLQYVESIGRALSGALQYEDVAHVLVQAMLDSIECDAAGVLLLHRNGEDVPWALVGGRKKLAPTAQTALVDRLREHLPAALRPSRAAVAVQELPAHTFEGTSAAGWQQIELGVLQVREAIEGVAVLARHALEPFSEEALGFFGIFTAQGGAALANAHLFARMRELATRDSVTGLCNHRHFFELLESEISRARRYNHPLAIIMLDMDRGPDIGLKAVNDAYGHQAGDDLLRLVAKFLQSQIRRSDLVARYGGDEFIILAPQSGEPEALALANRICERMRRASFRVMGHEVHPTMSIGAGVYSPGEDTGVIAIVNRADRGMYLAKERGGNQVCLAESKTREPKSTLDL